MNPTIEKLRVLQIIESMDFLTKESLERIIDVAEYVLRTRADEERARADEERFDQDYDDLLARQYEADRCDDFLRRSFMLHGQTNALEGIK